MAMIAITNQDKASTSIALPLQSIISSPSSHFANGSSVGDRVGRDEGIELGDIVGETEGRELGVCEGNRVGDSEGLGVMGM